MTTEVKKGEVCLNMWDRYLVFWESRRGKEEEGPELEARRESRTVEVQGTLLQCFQL